MAPTSEPRPGASNPPTSGPLLWCQAASGAGTRRRAPSAGGAAGGAGGARSEGPGCGRRMRAVVQVAGDREARIPPSGWPGRRAPWAGRRDGGPGGGGGRAGLAGTGTAGVARRSRPEPPGGRSGAIRRGAATGRATSGRAAAARPGRRDAGSRGRASPPGAAGGPQDYRRRLEPAGAGDRLGPGQDLRNDPGRLLGQLASRGWSSRYGRLGAEMLGSPRAIHPSHRNGCTWSPDQQRRFRTGDRSLRLHGTGSVLDRFGGLRPS